MSHGAGKPAIFNNLQDVVPRPNRYSGSVVAGWRVLSFLMLLLPVGDSDLLITQSPDRPILHV